MPCDLRSKIENLLANLFISAPTMTQLGAVAAFSAIEELDDHVARYRENRDILLYGLHPAFLGNHAPCDGAFYLYADVSALTDDSLSFAKALIEEEGVALTSGVDFDPEQGHHFVRLSFAGKTSDMKEAVRRINRFTERLLRPQQKSA